MLKWPTILTVVFLGVGLLSCSPADPRIVILEERARWSVELLGWAEGESGELTLSTRVSGPVHTTLSRLTCRVDFYDADSQVAETEWHTLDLTQVQRGKPTDFLIRFPPREFPVEQLSISAVPVPTPDEEARIEELEEL